jgi:ankyrin repeat protein
MKLLYILMPVLLSALPSLGQSKSVSNSANKTTVALSPAEQLLQAIWDGKTTEALALIEQGAPVDAKDKLGQNPLHLAAAKGEYNIMQLLLDKGVNIEEPTPDGNTALHLAAAGSRLAVVKLLLERGAEVNAKDDDGHTPLDYVENIGSPDSDEVAALLRGKGGKNSAGVETIGLKKKK